VGESPPERGARRVRGAEVVLAMDRRCSGTSTRRPVCSRLLIDGSHGELVPESRGESRNAERQADDMSRLALLQTRKRKSMWFNRLNQRLEVRVRTGHIGDKMDWRLGI